MQLIPAIDLKDGWVVQLVGGDPDQVAVAGGEPLETARNWMDQGAEWLHIVDLDHALGLGDHTQLIQELLADIHVPAQVGGGIRTVEDAKKFIAAGAKRVVVGTLATDESALRAFCAALPDQVIVAVDSRDGEVVAKGWTQPTGIRTTDLAAMAEDAGAAGILWTDVGREGRMVGIDREQLQAVVDATRLPVIASGGIADLDDLQAIQKSGAWGAVLGMSLYTGAIKYAKAKEALHA